MDYRNSIHHLHHLGANKIVIKYVGNKATLKTTIKKHPSRYFIMITQIDYDTFNILYNVNNKNIFSKTRINFDEYEITMGYIYTSIKNGIITIEQPNKKDQQ